VSSMQDLKTYSQSRRRRYPQCDFKPRVAVTTTDQRNTCFHGDCSNEIGLPPGSHHLFASASTPQGPHYETRIGGSPRSQHVLCSSFKPNCSLVTLQQNLHSAVFKVIDGAPSTPTDVRSSPYYFPQNFEPLQGMAL